MGANKGTVICSINASMKSNHTKTDYFYFFLLLLYEE